MNGVRVKLNQFTHRGIVDSDLIPFLSFISKKNKTDKEHLRVGFEPTTFIAVNMFMSSNDFLTAVDDKQTP